MILVLDVTGNPGKVVLGQTEQLTQVDLGEKRHSENLLPELQRLSHQFGRPQQLGVITGPGSFTGIRIGIATAMGLSTGWQIPLYAIDHFSLMAPLAPEDATLAVPAGRNRFYCK
ncbi:MAG: tRNA (adenosine(37)-N6)-threonylcarbamoyltransferase complex dimerization subunit type 1 TsaB, partial [Acidobacteria bacterium]|nr:tRNA (adenosine(37)-N6)-threonylcarbamoyltransferase complex dimerization subunit type 1 TsaB [Acidobacteriota bacterium]